MALPQIHVLLAAWHVTQLHVLYVNLDIIFKMEHASSIMEMEQLLQIVKVHLIQLIVNYAILAMLLALPINVSQHQHLTVKLLIVQFVQHLLILVKLVKSDFIRMEPLVLLFNAQLITV
jgi:hypothetical protein